MRASARVREPSCVHTGLSVSVSACGCVNACKCVLGVRVRITCVCTHTGSGVEVTGENREDGGGRSPARRHGLLL